MSNNDNKAKKAKAKAKAQASITKHQDELTSLENTDPEFFQFLQQNDSELLNFGQHDLDALDEEEGDDDDDMEGSGMIEVTQALLDAVTDKAKAGSLTALKQLLGIFRAACIPASDAAEGTRTSRYSVSTPEAYEWAMTKTIDAAHTSFYKILGLGASVSAGSMSKDSVAGLCKHAKWKKCEVLVLSFFKSVLHSIAALVDNRTTQQQSEVLVYLISSLEHYIPLLGSMHRLANTVLKALLGVWSLHHTDATSSSATSAAAAAAVASSASSSKKAKKAAIQKANAALALEQQSNSDAARVANDVRTYAFLRVRQAALLLPGSVAEDCFRCIYLAFTRHCKSYNEQTSGSVNYMIACVVELYSTDVALAYQLGFIYVRQLGLFLRTAMNKKTAEAIKQLVNWQYLNCIRLWTCVVCAMPKSGDLGLGDLAYPLVQVMVGVMSATPSCVYIPTKLHLLSMMQQAAASCKLFVPTAPKLVEMLEMPELQTKPTPSTEVAPKFSSIVRLASDAITKAVIRDVVVTEVVKLLRYEVEIYRYHPGIPEYFYLSNRKLRNFTKKCKNSKWKELVRAFVGHAEQVSCDAKRYRAALSKSPLQLALDGGDFEPLLPIAAGQLKSAESSSSKKLKGEGDNAVAAPAGLLPVELRLRKLVQGVQAGHGAVHSVPVPSKQQAAGAAAVGKVRFAELKAAASGGGSRRQATAIDSEDDDDDEDESGDDEDESGDDEDESEDEDDEDEDDAEEEDEVPQPSKRKMASSARAAPAAASKKPKHNSRHANAATTVADLDAEDDVVEAMPDSWSDDEN